MLDLQFERDLAVLFAQSHGHQDYAEYQAPADELRAAAAKVRALSVIPETEHFEHAWISHVVELVSDAAARPAVRRLVSQSLDEAAVARGLLLRPHWHCPRCGSPGSQWTAGCWQTFCVHPGPAARAHWDHCRVASHRELLTLMVSEGYERVGALAAGRQLRNLQADWRRLLRDVPQSLAADLDRWASDVHDAHSARAAEILEVAARLGNAVRLDGVLEPESLLSDAIQTAEFEHATSTNGGHARLESA